jgi:2-polyprenyl-3-methyl-5-hydroxy-6-metoxy-1,4-benzoquinol methylase
MQEGIAASTERHKPIFSTMRSLAANDRGSIVMSQSTSQEIQPHQKYCTVRSKDKPGAEMKKHNAYYSQCRPEMRNLIPHSTKSLLDVGCGSGSFGEAIRAERPEVRLSGIELFEDEAEKARIHYDEVWSGDVHEVLRKIRARTFDLIVFNDLLEHLIDPSLALRQSRELLSAEGNVLASIPNMRFWPALSDLVFQGDWRYRDAGVMDSTHLRFFTPKSIVRLFEHAGFRVLQMHGINKTWIRSWRWRICNLLMGGRLEDCLYPQFAVLAEPIR